MHQLLPLLRNGAVLGVLAVLTHCGGSDLTLPSQSRPANITKFDGDNQTASAGAALAAPLVVRVVDQRGDPVVSQRIAFTPGSDATGARVTPAEASTNPDGKAQAEWVLGGASGTQSLQASVVGSDELSVTFNASAVAAEPHHIEASGGNEQNGTVGAPLPSPLVVVVTDQFGNPVADVRVDWSAEDGSVDPASSTTGPDGQAATSWTLGSSTGAQSATASSGDLEGSPVGFTATATPGTANRLVLVSGNNQSAAPGQALAAPLLVRLEDDDGNGVPNQAVSWVVGSGGGSVSATTSTTDANGEAQVQWILGPNPGSNTLNAVVSGVGFVGFRANATTGSGGDGGGSSPSRLQFVVQPSNVERDKKMEPAVQVAVLDQNGDPVTEADLQIKLDLLGENEGKLKGGDHEKARSGIATFDDIKVDKEGEYRLRATADGIPAVDSDVFQVHEGDGDD